MIGSMKEYFNNFFSTIGRKMIVAVAAALIIAGGTFAYFAYRTGTAMLEEYGQDKGFTLAQYSKGVVEFMMLKGEKGHLQAAMRTVDTTGHITALFLLKPTGKVTVSTIPESTGTTFPVDRFVSNPDFSSGRFLSKTENGKPFQYVLLPVERKPECSSCHTGNAPVLGYMTVKVAMEKIREASYNHRNTNILMTVLTFTGIGIVISGALIFLVIRPVSSLRGQMSRLQTELDRVERGQELRFAPLRLPKRKDEISSLIMTYNSLVTRLNEAHAVLHELHQKQLEHADRLATTGEMAASMAHEIRNPIAGVLGALQVLDAELPDSDQNKPIMNEMMTQLERMNHAVNDLLSYARPSPPRFEDTDLNGIIERTLTILDSQIQKNRVSVRCSLAPGLPVLSADRKMLQQLLWNVIQNSIQAMENGGTLTVSTLSGNGSVEAVVKDTGRGIPKGEKDNIFRPFFTTRHQGTGLGLTISRSIVEQHHGSMELISEENRGTVCTIRLPFAGERAG